MAFHSRLAAATVAAALIAASVGCASQPRRPGRPPASQSASRTSSPTPSQAPSLLVAGRRIPAAGVADVAAAIRAAGMTVPDGRLLSVVTGSVLDAHASPATILLDGRPATLSTPVHAGDVITFVSGRDTVEPTHTVDVPVYLDPAAAALYASTRPGVAAVVEGTVSGEQVSSVLSRAPAVGRLRTPARLALTIDDGPSGYTSDVLGLLGASHVPAVFCVIGENALAYPALVRQELAAGDELCDHTQTHPASLPALTPARIAAEIDNGEKSIMSVDGGVAPVYFRAPGGNWSATVYTDARADHLIPLGWTVDPRDWSEPGTQVIITQVLDQLRPDGVVLMHDGGGNRSQTVAALGQLLGELAAAGWTFTFPTWIR